MPLRELQGRHIGCQFDRSIRLCGACLIDTIWSTTVAGLPHSTQRP
jgi:hypothetical protein